MISKEQWNKLQVGDTLISKGDREYKVLATYSFNEKTIKVRNHFQKKNEFRYMLPRDRHNFVTIKKQ